jgi:hypothetical protein
MPGSRPISFTMVMPASSALEGNTHKNPIQPHRPHMEPIHLTTSLSGLIPCQVIRSSVLVPACL